MVGLARSEGETADGSGVMKNGTFSSSPFERFLPIPWEIAPEWEPVFSLTRSHGLKTRFHLQNLGEGPLDEGNGETLISYEVAGRRYDLYTIDDLNKAAYSFDEVGISNMKGDLAERVARRVMKRFLQRFDSKLGKMGGLFDDSFDPKNRQGFVVANTNHHILKIGSYPNMILLKKTGRGKWGYQHVTDLDGLFDYRYLHSRHLIILESKTGRIDVNAEALYETLFVPLRELFPDALFTYVVFALQEYLLDHRNPDYRILQETPLRIYKALAREGIPSLFFHFNERENDFIDMCRHLVTCYRTYHRQNVSFQGRVRVSDHKVTIFNPGTTTPYLDLERDRKTGLYRIVQSARDFDEEDAAEP